MDKIDHKEFDDIAQSGFLPTTSPETTFPENRELEVLDEIGNALPQLLLKSDFRHYIRQLTIPEWPQEWQHIGFCRLYYVRLGFIASAYVN